MKKAVCLLLLKNSFDNKEVLVVERLKDKGLGLPGGKVENGETNIEAIIREAKEEVNLELKEEHLLLVYASLVNGYYCETYFVKPEYLHPKEINIEDIKQNEEHIVPKFVKFNNTDFVIPSIFMPYNRGLLINSDEIIESYNCELFLKGTVK